MVMDHIPKASSDFDHVDVPFLFDESCPFIYDNGVWMDYPTRAGWDLESFSDGDFTNRGRNTSIQAASFLQAWLYFGMLHCITGIPVETYDFVRIHDQSATRTVSMKDLGLYLARWKEAINGWPADERVSRTNAMDNSIREMTNIQVQYLGWKTPLPDVIVLSINILHKTLMRVKRAMLKHSDFEPRLNYFQGSRDLIDQRLSDRGWCVRDISRHHQGQSCLVMYYALSLGPRLVSRDHTACLNTECLTLQVDHATYRTQHVLPGCDCAHVGVDVTQICDLINQDQTPILTLSSRNDNPPKLHISSAGNDLNYVCISHVWANGFGNLHANSLPLCQLTRIQNYVNDLYPPSDSSYSNIPFWLDTLCVPVAADDYPTRRRAIIAMRDVYAHAAKVLVVDVELLAADCIGTSDEEIATRISYSIWFSRLWTLQEAVFAKKLYFQFRDAAVDAEELVRRSDAAASNSSYATKRALPFQLAQEITYEALNYLRELYAFKSAPPTSASRASFILQTVSWRSTSWASDEAVCLAAIFNLAPPAFASILSIPTSEPAARLRRFILHQRHFPAVALFFSGPKMDDADGFRWAPRSFVFGRASLLPAYQRRADRGAVGRFKREEEEEAAWAEERGLRVRFPGFRFAASALGNCARAAGGRMLFRDTGAAGLGGEEAPWYTFRMMDKTATRPFFDTEVDQIADLALVLPRIPDSRGLYYGVVVSIYREDADGVLFARMVARASVDAWGENDTVGIRIILGIDDPVVPAEAARLGEEQQWCIG